MAELDADLVDLLQTFQDGKIRALFSGLGPGFTPSVGQRTWVAGEVLSYGDDWIDLRALWFVPASGFTEPTGFSKITFSFDNVCNRCLRLAAGIEVICSGDRIDSDSNSVKLANAHLGFRPELEISLPWDVTHLFCGAFCGWHQGLQWLDTAAKTFYVGQEIFVDRDPEVMSIWQVKYASTARSLPLRSGDSWTPSKCVGLCGDVNDFSIIEACRAQANHLVTMSPPCQSWSKGGLKAGLHDDNGKAFLDALELSFSFQATVIAAECSDEIVGHPHFRVIKSFAHFLGFRLVWDQVTPYNPLVSHARTRWLGVWVRADLAGQSFPFHLKLPMIPRSHWTDQAYQFRLPSMWTSQLHLSPSECSIYDSIDFLPPAKRARFEKCSNLNKEIIRSRIPGGSEILPTLCASYTRQHNLAKHHLAQKGIFACIQEKASGFSFFDPAMFCSLFGATEHVVLSEKACDSFRFIGNAITVPHSVLTLCIAIHAISESKIDPIGLVRQAWSDRLTAYNSILFAHEGFVHLIPKHEFWNWITPREVITSEAHIWTISGTCIDRQIIFHACPDHTLRQVIQEHLSGPNTALEQNCGLNEDSHLHDRMTIAQIATHETTLRLVAGNATIGTCELSRNFQSAQTKVIDEPSSCGHSCEHFRIFRHDFQHHCRFDIFWKIQKIVETLQDDSSPKTVAANIIAIPEELSLTVFLTEESSRSFLHKISALPELQGRNKYIAGIPGEGNLYLLIADAKDCDRMPYADVILRLLGLPIGGFQIPLDNTMFAFQLTDVDQVLTISNINGHAAPSDRVSGHLQDGDIIDLCFASPTRAGGHHLNLVAPPHLPAFSDFTARIEFLCDTHGWAATDEMFHYTQALQWQQDWLKFGTPQLWNVANGDFEEPIFGELNIVNNATTAIPVLIGSHWAGIEITRQGADTRVTFVQVPQQLHTALTFLVARLLDIAPHRFQVACEYK